MKDNFIEDDEILEMAVAREVDAIKFYTMLASTACNTFTRRMFEELAAEEMEHKEKLELEIMKTGRVVDTQRLPTAFTGKLVDFVPPQTGDYKDVLNIGLKKEDTSFQLYMDLAARVNDPGSRETLIALAGEEARHKLRFQAELDRIAEEA